MVFTNIQGTDDVVCGSSELGEDIQKTEEQKTNHLDYKEAILVGLMLVQKNLEKQFPF